jgi:phosphoglycolate phosphatase-like HAD superfamily hydrolase
MTKHLQASNKFLRNEVCRVGKSLFERGYVHGSTGNISVRVPAEQGGGFLITPTDACLGFIEPDTLAWVDEQVVLHGGPARGAQAYLDLFSHAMRDRIDQKVASIHDDVSADALMVPGARAFLQLLTDNDVRIALVSGTEHIHLLRESAALRIDHFFDAGIHGPGPHHPGFTKGDAMAELIDTYRIANGQLLSVGDGPVEIIAGKSLAGYSLAVASHEVSGGLDDDKRRHLIATGADAVIANFQQLHDITTLLFGQE